MKWVSEFKNNKILYLSVFFLTAVFSGLATWPLGLSDMDAISASGGFISGIGQAVLVIWAIITFHRELPKFREQKLYEIKLQEFIKITEDLDKIGSRLTHYTTIRNGILNRDTDITEDSEELEKTIEQYEGDIDTLARHQNIARAIFSNKEISDELYKLHTFLSIDLNIITRLVGASNFQEMILSVLRIENRKFDFDDELKINEEKDFTIDCFLDLERTITGLLDKELFIYRKG